MSRLADIVAEFALVLADPSVTVEIQERERQRHEAPPRIAFVPKGGPITMTNEVGRQDLTVGTASRQLNQRNLTCELHCWGTDYDQTEQLVHNAVATMHAAILGSSIPVGETWVASGDTDMGWVRILEVQIQIPIMAGTQALVHPSAITHTGEFALQMPNYGMPGLLFGGGSKYGGNPENVC